MYVNTNELIKIAEESNTSVIGFICMDYVMARTVVYAAEATNTPALIMLYPEHISVQKTTGCQGYSTAVKELGNEVKVPIGLHMDHDYTYEAIMNSLSGGFESVMMDGSLHHLDKNIALTKQVVDKVHPLGVFVEGEIGHVGLAADSDNHKDDLYTKPEAAERFCRETDVDALAVSIGNAHGEYKQTPHLDFKRLEEIKAVAGKPLVLHGGSGIPDDQLLKAFSMGIRKFNLGTEYLSNYFKALKDFTDENEKNPDPVKVINMPEFVQAQLQPYVEGRLKALCKF